MTYYSLLCPLKTLTWFQLLLWPLIYAQLISLKMWVRKHYGRGVPYRFWVSPFGRVYLVQFPPDLTQSFSAPGALILPEFTFTTGIGTGAHAHAAAQDNSSVHAAPSSLQQSCGLQVSSIARLYLALGIEIPFPIPNTS